MKKKKIISALMAVAMCVSALPMSVYAESDTTAEYPEFTQKFIDAYMLAPEESEENRLIHNLFNSYYNDYFKIFYNGENMVFLGSDKNNSATQYYMEYTNFDTVPGHKDIKCVQCIYDCVSRLYFYIENPYISEEEFNALTYDEKVLTAEKIFDETGEYITKFTGTGGMSRYFIGEDGKAYDSSGREVDILNGQVIEVYCNPEELNICDGKKIYKYSDVYDGDPDTALRADFYQYLEDNNCQEVFKFFGEKNPDAYFTTEDYRWQTEIEDLSSETFITDTDGNIIPNDPDFLRIMDLYNDNTHIYVYNTDNKYIFEDVDGNRIVFSSFDDTEDNTDDAYIVFDFFCNHNIDESLNTDNVIETYLVTENDLKIYNTDILTTETLAGDANEDGNVSLADAVLIMQALSNPDEFALTEQGATNADYNGDGGVTTADALEIQILCIS